MYAAPHRPSILHRPLRGQSQATTETFDSQHEREQQYWAGKAQRSQDTHHRLTRALYPTAEDKREVAEELRQTIEQHALAKEQQRLQEQAREEVWMRPSTAKSDMPPADGKPWQATTYTTYLSKEEEDLARRRMASQVALDNRIMIQQNALRKASVEEAERQVARMTVMDESSFWNLGSTNDRWLPPERRRSPRGDSHLAANGAPIPVHQRAPYASGDAPQVLQVSPSPSQSPAQASDPYGYGSRPTTAAVTAAAAGTVQPPIWAWDEQAQQQPQQQQRGYGSGRVSAGAPWATDYDGGSAAAAPPPPSALGQGKGQYAGYGVGYAAGMPGAGAEGIQKHLLPSQSQRYSSRPASKPCPFATDSGDVAYAAVGGQQAGAQSARVTAESQGQWPRAVQEEVQGQWSQGAAPPLAPAVEAYPRATEEQWAQVQDQGYGQSYGQGQGQQAWARATQDSLASEAISVSASLQQQQGAWGIAPSLRYASRPAPQPRPYAYEEQDGPDRFAQPVPVPNSAPQPPPSRSGVAQRFGSRPEPHPCPYAVEASNSKPAAWGPAPEPRVQPFPWL